MLGQAHCSIQSIGSSGYNSVTKSDGYVRNLHKKFAVFVFFTSFFVIILFLYFFRIYVIQCLQFSKSCHSMVE